MTEQRTHANVNKPLAMGQLFRWLSSLLLCLPLTACRGQDNSGAGNDLRASGGTTQEDRIVGGSTFCGLPAAGVFTRNGGMWCSGTLVGPRKVLTAAHCISGVSASSLRYIIGPSLSQAQHTLSVASVTPHPNYNNFDLTNDIGFVTLSADAPVASMGVVQSMDNSWVGQSLFFVGYGNNNGPNHTGAGTKRAASMPIDTVNSSSFSYRTASKNTCNGDSGGPAFFRDGNGTYLVAGVTSYGDRDCVINGVDTRVDVYLSFLGLEGGTPPPPPGTDPCNGETYEGRCDGVQVIWCENEQIQSQNCSDSGKTCGWKQSEQYYGCVDSSTPPPTDSCNGETYEGRCDGNWVIWCENEQVQIQNCSHSGKTCGWKQSDQYYGCVSP